MYELEKIKILLVDSQPSIRGITEVVLKEFGAKNIVPMTTSVEALSTAISETPDIIVVDHVMRPEDGVDFTNHLRHQNLPLRQTPIIFTSSISAINRVYSARDAGITEFLAKPFTAETLYKRLVQVVEHPRSFVDAQNFKGPDRRRRTAPPPTGADRRGRHDMGEVLFSDPDRILRQRVGTGGLPPALLKAAQIKMEQARSNMPFRPIAMESLDWQRKTLEAYLSRQLDPTTTLRDLQDSWSLLKGNAASFGFSLIQEISKNLTDFLDLHTDINDDTVLIVEAHENAINGVIRNRIRDKRNPYGNALLEELKRANLRYFNKHYPRR